MSKYARYARQMILPEIGIAGQDRLSAARILCVGAGGLGCPALLYLAGAGVGHIGIVDNDCVDESNLQRQGLYTMNDVGRPKAMAARDHLLAFNPRVDVTAYTTRLTAENAQQLIDVYDIIIDGSDNFATRFLVNDACTMLGKPLIYGSVSKFEGQASVFDARHGPCYRCLFPEMPGVGFGGNCAEAGVIGVVPGLIGVIQATEAIKLIIGIGESLLGRLLLINTLTMTSYQLQISKDSHCPCCSKSKPTTLKEYVQGGCAMTTEEITATELLQLMERKTPHTLVDVREPDEYALCSITDAKLIPLREIPTRFNELDKNMLIILQCHHGRRSLQALQFLKTQGFTNLKNLTGGIDAWAEVCDPKMPRY